MHPVTSATPEPANDSAVVFVRPHTPCDTSDYSIIVDEHGRFVGNLTPGTKMTVPVSPGNHVFYAWGDRDVRFARGPNSNPVTAVRVQLRASETEYVALEVETVDEATVTRCWPYAVVAMHRLDSSGARSEDLHHWLDSSKLLAADRDAGQSALDRNPALLQSHLELGQAKLMSLEEASARKARRDAERAAGSE
jgi:hypothetical protein